MTSDIKNSLVTDQHKKEHLSAMRFFLNTNVLFALMSTVCKDCRIVEDALESWSLYTVRKVR